MHAAVVMQQAWREGVRRVRLFCADELRPAACCVVDALHTRGYDVALLTGTEAREALQLPAAADLLRVIWAPDGTTRGTRSRLREALDPDAAGDVLVLAAPTPRGVIDAIDAFGAPRRTRSRMQPRRTYLAQPTLLERKLDARGWTSSALAAGAIAAVLIGGLWLGAPSRPDAIQTPPVVAIESMSAPPRPTEPVLASGRASVELEELDDEEPVILETVTVATKAPKHREDEAVDDGPAPAPTEAAPLERSASAPMAAIPAALPHGGMPMGALQVGSGAQRPRAIDPF